MIPTSGRRFSPFALGLEPSLPKLADTGVIVKTLHQTQDLFHGRVDTVGKKTDVQMLLYPCNQISDGFRWVIESWRWCPLTFWLQKHCATTNHICLDWLLAQEIPKGLTPRMQSNTHTQYKAHSVHKNVQCAVRCGMCIVNHAECTVQCAEDAVCSTQGAKCVVCRVQGAQRVEPVRRSLCRVCSV